MRHFYIQLSGIHEKSVNITNLIVENFGTTPESDDEIVVHVCEDFAIERIHEKTTSMAKPDMPVPPETIYRKESKG